MVSAVPAFNAGLGAVDDNTGISEGIEDGSTGAASGVKADAGEADTDFCGDDEVVVEGVVDLSAES